MGHFSNLVYQRNGVEILKKCGTRAVFISPSQRRDLAQKWQRSTLKEPACISLAGIT
ncbi:sulfurtransferase complex subunit TusD [Sesbania bispinosa]|nr:sulfurtransferase complex subunit TusD [Sesbania bispinosa]